MKYYLIEKEKSNMGTVLFWGKNKRGYTSDINNAGIYEDDDVSDYLGKSKETYAIRKDIFEAIMKTSKVVYNYSDFYSIMHDIDNNLKYVEGKK